MSGGAGLRSEFDACARIVDRDGDLAAHVEGDVGVFVACGDAEYDRNPQRTDIGLR